MSAVHHDRIAAVAAEQHGVFAQRQAIALGLTQDELDYGVRCRRWDRVCLGVFHVTGAPATDRSAVLAAVLEAGADAVAARRTAAGLWRLPGFHLLPVDVLRRTGLGERPPHARVGRSLIVPEHHLTVVEAIPVTTPERTIFDLCAVVHALRAERALDNALAMRLTDVRRLGRLEVELCKRGRNGSALFRRLLDVRGIGYVAPESELEARALKLFEQGGLPPPVRQFSVGDELPVGRIDLAWPRHKVLVELDSRRHHTALLDRQRDHQRDLALAAAGWRIIRLTWEQLTQDAAAVLRQIKAILAAAA